MQARQFYSRVSVEADIESLEDARQAAAAVLRALRDRLTVEEAAHASAQLPQSLHFAASMTERSSPSLIACSGHSGRQAPQATHSSLIR